MHNCCSLDISFFREMVVFANPNRPEDSETLRTVCLKPTTTARLGDLNLLYPLCSGLMQNNSPFYMWMHIVAASALAYPVVVFVKQQSRGTFICPQIFICEVEPLCH